MDKRLIEVKIYFEKHGSGRKVHTNGEERELYGVRAIDSEGNEYNIESFLFAAGDARGTVAYENGNKRESE